MAAGSDFTAVPNLVVPIEPIYNNVESETESQKKEYYNIAATAIKKWQLTFNVETSTEMNALLTHFNDQSGGYYPFAWKSVPSYIESGSNITGRWVDGSLSISQNSNSWKISITFEKAN